LLGLLSLLDALLNMPMEDVLAGLPVDEEIKNALFGLPSRFRGVFETALDYEHGTWEQLEASAQAAGLDEQRIPQLFTEALTWSDKILSEALEPATK
jgi:EAL and modified HD-GYP domain-containing signal transduction protein